MHWTPSGPIEPGWPALGKLALWGLLETNFHGTVAFFGKKKRRKEQKKKKNNEEEEDEDEDEHEREEEEDEEGEIEDP